MKIQYVFRHLDQSEFIKSFAQDHIEKVLTRHQYHPDLQGTVKLEMENSPQHAGKDSFCCEIRVRSPRHGMLVIKKRTANMYEAITAASDRLVNALERVKGRFRASRRRLRTPMPELALSPIPIT